MASAAERPGWIDLRGKVAVVTGAAAGIGRAAAAGLAAAGAVTLVLDIDGLGANTAAAMIVDAGGKAQARALDVTEQDGWDAVAAWVSADWGRFDILVNCAGIAPTDRVGDDTLQTYRRAFAINVEGSLLGMRTALRFMRAAGTGAIINVASTASLKGNPIMASYGASKAAIAHYTRSAALETARAGHDIRINSVHPGLIQTAIGDEFCQIFSRLGPPDAVVSAMTTGRAGRPEEVADLIVFLASGRASFISGAAIVIDRAASV